MGGLESVSLQLILIALCVNLARSNCPLHGCKPSCSYSSDAQFVADGKQPRLLWGWRGVGGVRPSGTGCVTNAARIVCPVTGEDK